MCPADALKLSSTTPIWHEVYDPVTNSWVEAAPLPTPRSGTAGAVLDGRVLVFGGQEPAGVFRKNEAYDPATDTWKEFVSLPTPDMVSAQPRWTALSIPPPARP